MSIDAATEPRRPLLRILRGLAGAFIGGAGSVVIVAIIAVGRLAFRWSFAETTAFDRELDLQEIRTEWAIPMIGCALVGACAGWVTFAPRGRFEFVQSLLVVFSFSVLLMAVSGVLLPTRRLKGEPAFDLSSPRAIAFVCSPLVVTAILTVVRMRCAAKNEGEPSSAAQR